MASSLPTDSRVLPGCSFHVQLQSTAITCFVPVGNNHYKRSFTQETVNHLPTAGDNSFSSSPTLCVNAVYVKQVLGSCIALTNAWTSTFGICPFLRLPATSSAHGYGLNAHVTNYHIPDLHHLTIRFSWIL